MAKAQALVIGINKVDPKHYDGWDGFLAVCENDAKDFSSYLKTKKLKSITTLLTKSASRDVVKKGLENAAKNLVKGDLFVVYYSGHGGNEIPDINGDDHDGFDETWCLFDGELLDDELLLAWRKFKAGVRIVVVSDSCFSGDIVKFNPLRLKIEKTKAMPPQVGMATYKKNKSFYDAVAESVKDADLKEEKKTGGFKTKVKATVLQISSSQEWQPSIPETDDFPKNSLFTGVMMKEIKENKKMKTFTDLIKQTKKKMPVYQTPKHQVIGSKNIPILSNGIFKI
ncbi:MAG: caspase family protein [Chitinophagales bacterium]